MGDLAGTPDTNLRRQELRLVGPTRGHPERGHTRLQRSGKANPTINSAACAIRPNSGAQGRAALPAAILRSWVTSHAPN